VETDEIWDCNSEDTNRPRWRDVYLRVHGSEIPIINHE